MEDLKRELEKLKTMFNQKDEENRKLNESLESTLQKLEESRQVLKKNEEGACIQVFQYFHLLVISFVFNLCHLTHFTIKFSSQNKLK